MSGAAQVREIPEGGLVDPQTFRAAMSAVAGPVTVVTGIDHRGAPWGFTASSLVSVSVTPPLVLVSVGNLSSCRQGLLQCQEFVVSVLGGSQRDLALRFATPDVDRFAGLHCPRWRGCGPPFFPDAVVTLHCERWQVVPAGDHHLVLGAVTAAVPGADGAVPAEGTAAGATDPLVWVRRGFARPVADPPPVDPPPAGPPPADPPPADPRRITRPGAAEAARPGAGS